MFLTLKDYLNSGLTNARHKQKINRRHRSDSEYGRRRYRHKQRIDKSVYFPARYVSFYKKILRMKRKYLFLNEQNLKKYNKYLFQNKNPILNYSFKISRRLMNYLSQNYSAAQAAKLLKAGHVYVNGQQIKQPDFQVRDHDLVYIDTPKFNKRNRFNHGKGIVCEGEYQLAYTDIMPSRSEIDRAEVRHVFSRSNK